MATIRFGSTGKDVARWQQVLGVAVDGVFGKETEAATKRWQQGHGLTPDGVVGPATWSAAGAPVPAPTPYLGRVEKVPYGARIVDSYPFSAGGTAEQARRLKAAAVDGVVVYTDVATREICEAVIAAGLGLLSVTRAGEYNDGSADELAWYRKVGYTPGASAALDFEGLPAFEAGKKDPAKLASLLRGWANDVDAAGWEPVLYLGAPQPLTSKEIDELHMAGVWLGIGAARDRNNALVYPASGYVLRQDWHGEATGLVWRDTGVLVDHNSAQKDHWGRTLSWVIAA